MVSYSFSRSIVNENDWFYKRKKKIFIFLYIPWYGSLMHLSSGWRPVNQSARQCTSKKMSIRASQSGGYNFVIWILGPPYSQTRVEKCVDMQIPDGQQWAPFVASIAWGFFQRERGVLPARRARRAANTLFKTHTHTHTHVSKRTKVRHPVLFSFLLFCSLALSPGESSAYLNNRT